MARLRGHASKTHPKRLKATQTALAALQLREQHLTYREIAERLDYHSAMAAYMAVSNLLKSVKADTCEEYRQLNSERLEKQLANILPFTLPKKLGGRLTLNTDALREYRMYLAELNKLHGCYVDVTINTGPQIGQVNVQNNNQTNILRVPLDLKGLSEDELIVWQKILTKIEVQKIDAPPQNGNGHTEGLDGDKGAASEETT